MLARSRRTFLLLVAATVSTVACNPANAPAAEKNPAPAVLPPFQQELASIKAEVTLPGSWKYGYRLIDRPDTTFGGHQAIEFHYTADSASGVPPRLLMVIRAYKKPVWEKVRDSQSKVSKVLAEHDGEVYTYSVVTMSPYPVGTASTLRVDQMMTGLMAETSPFRMTFRR